MSPHGILVVSSERAVANVAQSALAYQSMSVMSVHSYREAMCALVKKHIVAILCDETLPDGSWKDIVGQIAMIQEPPLLLLLVSLSNRMLWAEAIDFGVYDVISKPLDPTEI